MSLERAGTVGLREKLWSSKWDIFIDPGSRNGCVLLIGRLERSAEVKLFAESLPAEALQGPLYYLDANASNYVVGFL
jgi:hypothetical protein